MKEDQHRFLSLRRLPARLTAEQVAWLINSQPHDIPVLVSARLLKPLGSPLPNAVKYFATVDLEELVRDRSWLVKVTNAISVNWQTKNERKRNRRVIGLGADGPVQLGLPSAVEKAA